MACRGILVLATLIAAGCAAPTADNAAPQTWPRDPAHDPWHGSGVSPTARSIAFALYEDAYELDRENCPFAAHRCAKGNTSAAEDFIAVDRVRCRQTGLHEDRCSFALAETNPNGGRVNQSCTGTFEIVGHSDYPMRWGIVEGDYDRLVLKCRR